MFGNEIKSNRISRGLTQTEISKATGIPQNTLSWIEADKGLANILQCVQLADFYGISLDELVGRDYGRETKPKSYDIHHNKTVNVY